MEEVFGPVLAVIRVKSFDEAIRVDGEKREATARTALQAVGTRLAEVRKDLDEVNTRIRQFNLDKGIMISDENERQQIVALTTAQWAGLDSTDFAALGSAPRMPSGGPPHTPRCGSEHSIGPVHGWRMA